MRRALENKRLSDFRTAANDIRIRAGVMQGAMNQYKQVWRSNKPIKDKINKMNALVWNKGRWSLHLFPLSPTLIRTIDGSQARFLRRILKVPASFISRVSHKTIRRRCSTLRFSTFIFRSQLRWLGQSHPPQTTRPPAPPRFVSTPHRSRTPPTPHQRSCHEGLSWPPRS